MENNKDHNNLNYSSHRTDPLISVIIPTYNRASFIKRSVNSVIRQSYRNLEIIVVDDGSTDNTETLMKTYCDNRIKYIKYTQNKGVSRARNTGIKIARGEYICFLDSDDEIYPNKIEIQLNKLHVLPNTYGLIYCGHRIFINSTNEYVEEFLAQKYDNIRETILKKCLFAVHAPLIRKICFDKCGLFDESLVECEDWDMWIRLSQDYKFTFIPDALTKFYIHEGQKSTHLKNKIRARENILLKHKKLLEDRKLIYSWHLRRIGSLYSLDGNAAEGRRYLLKSILANPGNFGSYLHLILSVISSNTHRKIIMKYGVQTIGNVRLTF